MKTFYKKRELVSTAAEASSFSIKAGEKAFSVLRDSLYTDKPQSIVRETFTNAYDAHLSVGKGDVPFEVTFPTSWEPTFRVRDFGPGMPHEFMMGNYAVAFHSEKDDSNDQVGGFGLGRMSAFSYTDSYSVTVMQQGLKRYYSIVINEVGVPEVNFLGQEETDLPDGTEVSFPINNVDIKAFATAMDRVVLGFDVKPKVINSDQFSGWKEETPITSGAFYRVYATVGSPSSFQPGVYAKMGCVIYPIDTKLVTSEEVINRYANVCLVIDFPIGSLGVIASREALSYGKNEPTVSSIKKRLEQLKQTILDDFDKQMRACATFQEAFQKAADIRSTTRAIRLGKGTDVTWFGREIKSYYNLPKGLVVSHESQYRGTRTHYDFRASDTVGSLDSGHFPAVVYVIDETDSRIVRRKARITKHAEGVQGSKMYILLSHKEELPLFQSFLTDFPDLNYVMVHDLPDPGVTKTGSRPVNAKKVEHKYVYGGHEWLEDVTFSPESFDKGGYYINICHNESEDTLELVDGRTKKGLSFRVLEKAFEFCKKEVDKTCTQENLIAVPRTIQSKFEEHPKWINLFDVLSRVLSDKAGQTAMRVACKAVRASDKVKAVRNLSGTPEGRKINSFFERVERLSSDPKDVIWQHIFGVDPELLHKYQRNLATLAEEVYTRYPLLKFYTKEHATDFEEYMKLVDQKEKQHEQV